MPRSPNVSTTAQVDAVLGGGKQLLRRSEFRKENLLSTVLGPIPSVADRVARAHRGHFYLGDFTICLVSQLNVYDRLFFF